MKGKEKSIYIQNTTLERWERFSKTYEQNIIKVEATQKEMRYQNKRLVLYK